VLGRGAEGGQQHLHLFVLGARGEEWSAGVNFEDEAAEAPDVDLVVVGLHEDDFWGAVVPALDVGEFFAAVEAGRAEVDEFDS
jgi:Zn-dependent alcohol dehydrogenase